MKWQELLEEVWRANVELPVRGLVLGTWGNASGIDRATGKIAIKPSGISFGGLSPSDLATVDLDGNQAEGSRKPSTDTPTHLALYKAWPAVGGIVHTHSHYATAWAQSRRPIPCFGTTHADHFHGPVPVTDDCDTGERYEAATGEAIIACIGRQDPLEMPAALVAGHGAFAWGATPTEALENATVLEEVARMALHTLMLNPSAKPISQELLDRHFRRKHGPGAYYGQKD